jgi:hypothetical protein
MSHTTFVLLVFVATGLVLAGLSIPLLQERVPPNRWYGFRDRRALSDEKVWYAVNAVAGRSMLGAAIAQIVAAIVLYHVPGLSEQLYVLLVAAVIVLGAMNMVRSASACLRDLTE